MPRIVLAILTGGLVLASSCSSPPAQPAPDAGLATPVKVTCAPPASATAGQTQALSELQSAVEKSPLYLAAAAGGPMVSCEVTSRGSSLTLAYRFQDGATFTANRDSQIEYSNQDVAFVSAPAESAVAILQRAERDGFGADGCGIDWKKSSSEPSGEGSTAQVFRGSSCSCQARIRRDEGGRVIGLSLRSSC